VGIILIFIPPTTDEILIRDIKMIKATLMKMQLLKTSHKLIYPEFVDNVRRVFFSFLSIGFSCTGDEDRPFCCVTCAPKNYLPRSEVKFNSIFIEKKNVKVYTYRVKRTVDVITSQL